MTVTMTTMPTRSHTEGVNALMNGSPHKSVGCCEQDFFETFSFSMKSKVTLKSFWKWYQLHQNLKLSNRFLLHRKFLRHGQKIMLSRKFPAVTCPAGYNGDGTLFGRFACWSSENTKGQEFKNRTFPLPCPDVSQSGWLLALPACGCGFACARRSATRAKTLVSNGTPTDPKWQMPWQFSLHRPPSDEVEKKVAEPSASSISPRST